MVSQEIESVKRYSLSLTTTPLDVVYNRVTVSRIKRFFSSSSSSSSVYDADKIGSVVGGVDHTLLDNVLVKLDISAPHILIPQDVTQSDSNMVSLRTCIYIHVPVYTYMYLYVRIDTCTCMYVLLHTCTCSTCIFVFNLFLGDH